MLPLTFINSLVVKKIYLESYQRLKTESDVTKLLLASFTNKRDLTKLRRRRQREGQKSNRFNEQNNNSARFFVHFFAVPTKLRHEMTKFLGPVHTYPF